MTRIMSKWAAQEKSSLWLSDREEGEEREGKKQ